MRTEVGSVKNHKEPKAPLWKRILWLVVIYGASVLALGVVATLFRMMMTAAGMRSHRQRQHQLLSVWRGREYLQ